MKYWSSADLLLIKKIPWNGFYRSGQRYQYFDRFRQVFVYYSMSISITNMQINK